MGDAGGILAALEDDQDLPEEPEPAVPPIVRPPGRPVPQKPLYTQAQKDRAIHWLNIGISCRQVAAMTGHRCHSGTVCRWRKEAQETKTAKRRLNQLLVDAKKGKYV